MSFVSLYDPLNLLSKGMGTISGWLADDTMSLAAKAGVSVGPEVFNTLNPVMTKAPSDLMVAYSQAVYFISLAARRAMRNRETDVASRLLAALNQVEMAGEAAFREANTLCTTTGLFCPGQGGGAVLGDAIEAIESSGLNPDDMITITSILKANKRAYQFLQALPYLAVAGVSTLTFFWWRSKK